MTWYVKETHSRPPQGGQSCNHGTDPGHRPCCQTVRVQLSHSGTSCAYRQAHPLSGCLATHKQGVVGALLSQIPKCTQDPDLCPVRQQV